MCLKISSLFEIFVSPIALVPHMFDPHTVTARNGRSSMPVFVDQLSLVSISDMSPCECTFQILKSLVILSVLLGVTSSSISKAGF